LRVRIPTIRRDIATWRDPEIEMRPDGARIYARVKARIVRQNQTVPDFGISDQGISLPRKSGKKN